MLRTKSKLKSKLYSCVAGAILAFAPLPAAAYSVTANAGLTQLNAGNHSMTSSSFSGTANTTIVVLGSTTLSNSADVIVTTDNTGGAITWSTPYQCATTGAPNNITFSIIGRITSSFTSKTITLSDTAVAGTLFAKGAFTASLVTGTAATSIEDVSARNCLGSTTATANPNLTSNAPTAAGEIFFAAYNGQRNSSGASFTEDTTNGWTNVFSAFGGAGQADAGSYVVNATSSAIAHNPVVTSAAYSHQIIALCLPTGCSPPSPSNFAKSMFRAIP